MKLPTPSDRTLVVLVAAGTMLTFGILLLGGFGVVTGESLAVVMYRSIQLLPYVAGIVLFGLLIRGLLELNDTGDDPFGELARSGRTRDTGAEPMDETLSTAFEAQYLDSSRRATDEIRACLVAAAVRLIRTAEGASEATAEEAVSAGTWTDDHVASAYLSEDYLAPVFDRLYQFVDPGRAYRWRVRRTVAAIEALENRATVSIDGSHSEDGEEAETEPSIDDDELVPSSVPRSDGGHAVGQGSAFDGVTGGANRSQSVDPDVTESVASIQWALLATVIFVCLGIAAGSQLLVIAATVPLWYAAAWNFAMNPGHSVAISRDIAVTSDGSDDKQRDDTGSNDDSKAALSGDPGDRLRVRTTVENVGSEPLVDLRILDRIPDSLALQDGSASRAMTLAPGERDTLTYDLELRRGDHAFGGAEVRSRDITGVVSHSWTVSVDGDDAVQCTPIVETVPLTGGTNDYAGQIPTDQGGSGIEFHSVREYQPGDAAHSIDWRRYASVRELATVEYRAERATRIVCIVDARDTERRTAANSRIDWVSLSTTAAEKVFQTLVTSGHPTGLVGLYDDRFWKSLQYVSPGTGPATRQAVEHLLDALQDGTQGDLPSIHELRGEHGRKIRGILSGEAQIFLFSSVTDDHPVEIVRLLRSQGYVVHVISPDVTANPDTLGGKIERLCRDNRLARARSTGAHVVDWDLKRPVGLVIEEAISEVDRT